MAKRADPDHDQDRAIDAAARAWAAAQEKAVTAHPEADELVDYQEGRLDPGRAERLRRHLVVCPACREELLLLDGFDRELPEGSPLYPPDEATERGWRRFQAARAAMRAAPGAAPREPAADVPEPRFRASGRRWRLAASILLALAAGALLAALLLGRQRPDQVAGSPFVLDLDPAGEAVLRDASAPPEVVVPAGMDPLVPRLNLGDLTAHEGYLVEVYDPGGRLLLRRRGLVREPAGSVTFMAYRAEWPAGECRVLLIGLDGGRRQELAAYAFRLRYAS